MSSGTTPTATITISQIIQLIEGIGGNIPTFLAMIQAAENDPAIKAALAKIVPSLANLPDLLTKVGPYIAFFQNLESVIVQVFPPKS